MCAWVGGPSEPHTRAAANALTGATVDWEGLPPATKRVFLAVAMAVHVADRMEPRVEPA